MPAPEGPLGLGIDSDPFIEGAFWAAMGAAVLSALLILNILALRLVEILRERRKAHFEARWRPLLVSTLMGATVRLPRLARRNRWNFLHEWNRLQASVRGDAREHLRAAFDRLGLRPWARRLLRSPSLRKRMWGVVTLGHLGDNPSWPDLVRLAHDPNPTLSIAAARALAHIDPVAAVPELMPLIARRSDWALAREAHLLNEVDLAELCRHLLAELPEADAQAAFRYTRLLGQVACRGAGPVIAAQLRSRTEGELLAALLRALKDPRLVGDARLLANHPYGFVRVQAVSALGRMGSSQDFEVLRQRLADPEWWVRYRAAQSLVHLPGVARDGLKGLVVQEEDPFSRDMLRQVLAEQEAEG